MSEIPVAKRARTDNGKAPNGDADHNGAHADLPETFVAGFHDEAAVRAMRYRELMPGMHVSVVSLGASSLGGCFRKVSEDECIEVVRHALRSGINLIDTAPWYGHGKSETVLGKALAGVPRRAYYLNTKVGRYEPQVDQMFDFTGPRVTRSVDESLARLGCGYIDSVQVHDPEFAPSPDVIVDETLPALHALKAAGKVRLVGMTGYPLDLQREIISRAAAKGVPVDTSLTYCHYSMNDTTLFAPMPPAGGDGDGGANLGNGAGESFAAFCKRLGIGLINASPISMGLLCDRGPPSWHPASAEIRAACAAAAAYCRAQDPPVDLAKLAMHFSLGHEGVATTLVSTASPVRSRENVAYARKDAALSAHERAASEHIMRAFLGDSLDVKTWTSTEVDAYWRKLGKLLQTRKLYPAFATKK